jgi:hypothetical protein
MISSPTLKTERRGRVEFISRPDDRLSWLRVFVVFLSLCRQIGGYHLKIRQRPPPKLFFANFESWQLYLHQQGIHIHNISLQSKGVSLKIALLCVDLTWSDSEFVTYTYLIQILVTVTNCKLYLNSLCVWIMLFIYLFITRRTLKLLHYWSRMWMDGGMEWWVVGGRMDRWI